LAKLSQCFEEIRDAHRAVEFARRRRIENAQGKAGGTRVTSICTVDIHCAVQEHKSHAFLTGMKALKMPWEESEDSEDEEEATRPRPGPQMQQGEGVPQIEHQQFVDPEEGSIVNDGTPEHQDRMNDAERALGRSRYRLLMEMVPMMRNLLAVHVPADELEDFLARHVQNLNNLIMGDQDDHN
jgi:hypothetical protein